jgi:glycine cleavage system H protein
MSDDITWTKLEPGKTRIGLRKAFVKNHRVAFIELVPVGTQLSEGEPFALVQQRAGRELELESPVAGRVTSINAAINVVDDPAAINDDPEGAGWLIVVE